MGAPLEPQLGSLADLFAVKRGWSDLGEWHSTGAQDHDGCMGDLGLTIDRGDIYHGNPERWASGMAGTVCR